MNQLDDVLAGESNWGIHHGDCIPFMDESAEEFGPWVDHIVTSPPFVSLYAYSSEASDIGNSEGFQGENKLHLSYFYRGLRKVLKPGRVAIIHLMQIPRMKRNDEVGLNDFRGLNIRLGERAGLIYEYDWLVRKGPQAQAIRNHARELQFAGFESDRAACRGCLCDYLVKFRVPGENKVKVASKGELVRNDWIDLAEGPWMGVQETDTLQVSDGRQRFDENDTRHPCPLQLEVIRRSILLFTNPGELVFTPFAGIGSELYVAIGGKSPKTGCKIEFPRRAFGCDIKAKYIEVAKNNLREAERQMKENAESMLPLTYE